MRVVLFIVLVRVHTVCKIIFLFWKRVEIGAIEESVLLLLNIKFNHFANISSIVKSNLGYYNKLHLF